MTTTIAFIRHGEVENPDNIIYGRLPRFRLSATGMAEAQHAARLLQGAPLEALYTSPLLRARQTAREIARFHPGVRIKNSSLLTEILTPLQGRKKEDASGSGSPSEHYDEEGAEQPADVLARVLRFVTKMRKHHRGKTVAAVSHGDLIFTLLLFAHGVIIDANEVQRYKRTRRIFYPPTGSVTLATFETVGPDELPQCTFLGAGQVM